MRGVHLLYRRNKTAGPLRDGRWSMADAGVRSMLPRR
jgi:hypothetical protein